MRKIGYIALSLYLLLVGMTATVADFIVPNLLMAFLVLVASFGIFLDACLPVRRMSYRPIRTVVKPISEKNEGENR